jgi:hypothetical protein
MVGYRRWNQYEIFRVDGGELSIMGHDRPRWRFRISALMLLVIIVALALTPSMTTMTTIADRRGHARGSDRCREVS